MAVDINEGIFPDRIWEVDVRRAHEARKEAADRREDQKEKADLEKHKRKLDRDRKRVCEYLAKVGSACESTIGKNSGMNGPRTKQVIDIMLSEDELVECDVLTGNQKKPKRGYRLPK